MAKSWYFQGLLDGGICIYHVEFYYQDFFGVDYVGGCQWIHPHLIAKTNLKLNGPFLCFSLTELTWIIKVVSPHGRKVFGQRIAWKSSPLHSNSTWYQHVPCPYLFYERSLVTSGTFLPRVTMLASNKMTPFPMNDTLDSTEIITPHQFPKDSCGRSVVQNTTANKIESQRICRSAPIATTVGRITLAGV